MNCFPSSVAVYLTQSELHEESMRMEKDHQLNSDISHFDAPLICFSPS